MDNTNRNTHRLGVLYSIPMCIILLIFFFPVGLVLIFTRLYRKGKISKRTKNILIAADALLFIAMIASLGEPYTEDSIRPKKDTPQMTDQRTIDNQDSQTTDFDKQEEMKKKEQYQDALAAMSHEDYKKAIELFSALENYEDAPQKLMESRYLYANKLEDRGDYDTAYSYYQKVTGERKDSAQKRMEAIKCVDIANQIIDELIPDDTVETAIAYWYLGQFGLDSTPEAEYSISTYTFTYRVYLSSFLDAAYTLGTALGASDEWSDEDTEVEQDIFSQFYDAGFKNITIATEVCKANGDLLHANTYTLEDYLQDIAASQQSPNAEADFVPNTTDMPDNTSIDGVPLTSDELIALEDYFNSVEHNGLLRFPYNGISDNSDFSRYLSCVFYDLTEDISTITETEWQAIENAGILLEGDIHKLSTEYIIDYLAANYGEDKVKIFAILSSDFNQLGTYLSEYDAYYDSCFDTDMRHYTFDKGLTLRDGTVRLYYTSNVYLYDSSDELAILWEQPMSVDIRPNEYGGWYVISSCIE